MRTHRYEATIQWTGNRGTGTATYRGYDRAHRISIPGKAEILGSSDPAFLGDRSRHNPEELLVAALSACHMLWYLHLCAGAGIVVTGYCDDAEGTMVEEADGAGQFSEVVLRPLVQLAPGSGRAQAERLHAAAHAKCFIARSVNFPVRVEPAFPNAPTARQEPANSSRAGTPD
jgi:organic hydroperoxide reductase OsmC/OhrA